jgi:hypothetical protein
METEIVAARGAVVRIWVDRRSADRAFADITPPSDWLRLLVNRIFARLFFFLYKGLLCRSLVFNRHGKYFLTNNNKTARNIALLSHSGKLLISGSRALNLCLLRRSIYCGSHASKSQAVRIRSKTTSLFDTADKGIGHAPTCHPRLDICLNSTWTAHGTIQFQSGCDGDSADAG